MSYPARKPFVAGMSDASEVDLRFGKCACGLD
jgi:hypothetical protein